MAMGRPCSLAKATTSLRAHARLEVPDFAELTAGTDVVVSVSVVDAAGIVWNNPIGSPEPRRATLDEMLTGTLHGIWIDTRAYLRAVHREPDALRLDLTTASGERVFADNLVATFVPAD